MENKPYEDTKEITLIPLKKELPIEKNAKKKQDTKLFAPRKFIRRRRTKKPLTLKQKLVRGGIAGVAGLGITLAGLFGSPEELTQQQMLKQLNQPAIELVIDETETDQEEQSRKQDALSGNRKGLWGRLVDSARAFFLRIPAAVRMIVGVPLWAAGYVLIHLGSGLFGTFLSPVLRHGAEFLIFAMILLGIFILVMKTVFPDMPLKKILSKRNIVGVLIGAGVLKAADIVLPLIWQDYGRWKTIVLFAAGLIVLGALVAPRVREQLKKQMGVGTYEIKA